MDVNAYYALGVPFYLALFGSEWLIKRRRGLPPFTFGNTFSNLSTGVGLVIVGLFLGPILLALYEQFYTHCALVRWPDGSPIPWVLGFVAGDFCYYWHHRAGHTIAALWAIHGVHHQSEQFDSGIALRTPWFADLYSAPFYALAPLLGVPAPQFFIGISLLTLYSMTIHSLAFDRRSVLFLVTPGTHIAHHATHPHYRDHNYSAVFNVWDRLFGTYVEVDPADNLGLGIDSGYGTHDGARANWDLFAELVAIARQTTSWRERVRVFLGRPGWLPPGAVRPSPGRARAEESIPAGVRAHVAPQLVATMAFAMYATWLRDRHSGGLLLAASLAILGTLSTLGGLVDGRPAAARFERARLALTVVLGAALTATGRWGAGLALILSAALGCATLRRAC